MSQAVGSWALEMSSPVGRRSFVLELLDAPASGWARDPEGHVALAHVAFAGDGVTFKLTVDQPIKLATTWALTASGDRIAGTVRAGILPAMKVSGTRVVTSAGGSTSADGRTSPEVPTSAEASAEPAEAGSAAREAGLRTRAAVLRAPEGRFTIEDVHLAAPTGHEVLVRLVAAGMCHTDAVARTAWTAPIVLGHEGAGVVAAVGPDVTSLQVGDHVILTFDSCGVCRGCRAGRPFDCAEFDLRNLSGRGADGLTSARDGAGGPLANRWFGQSSFATHCLATDRNAVPVDKDLPLEVLAPLGCGVMTGVGSVHNVMRLGAGQRLAVFGAGAVGLSAVMAARAAGAGEIVAADLHESRRALALELGADRVVDPTQVQDLAEAVVGDGDGFDFSLDTTAKEVVMRAATEVLGRPGLCVLVGAGLDPLTVLPSSLAGKTVTYAYMGHADPGTFIPTLIGMWRRGLLPVERLEATFALEDVDAAERASADGSAIKPVLLMPTDPRPGQS